MKEGSNRYYKYYDTKMIVKLEKDDNTIIETYIKVKDGDAYLEKYKMDKSISYESSGKEKSYSKYTLIERNKITTI